MSNIIQNRYEFVMLFDVENGNPNGDPDAGNLPRIDPETSHGLVTDVCLKRKIRNYVAAVKGGEEGYDIYVREGAVLNAQNRKAYNALGIEPIEKKLPKKEEDARRLTAFMCHHFFDIRAFGAVMTTEINCGQVRGPVQLGFARSIDPIVPQEITITRVAVTSEKDAERKDREMGRKHIVPYGLYRVEGYVSACLAEKTGFSEDDLELLWEALTNMFDHDRSAARGKMGTRRLIVFRHESKLGNVPAHRLFECVSVRREDASRPPRSYQDYKVDLNIAGIPAGVQIIEKV
ncbi:MAG TPA: type I-C CRISPR-associated protein Cas7/Csd2 [Firmicutes bacterium]|nr:type I-C CRISPR-associated protein Cas7/Csd2 [Bacillota bacterium]